MDKAPDAFRTISEVADDLDIPQHVLRFWETRFSQIKPMKRSGGRRYYRPDDVDLLRGIRRLLYGEGYTIRGVQRILKENGIKAVQGLVGNAAGPGLGSLPGLSDRSPARAEPVLRAPPRRAPAPVEEPEDGLEDELEDDTDAGQDEADDAEEAGEEDEPEADDARNDDEGEEDEDEEAGEDEGEEDEEGEDEDRPAAAAASPAPVRGPDTVRRPLGESRANFVARPAEPALPAPPRPPITAAPRRLDRERLEAVLGELLAVRALLDTAMKDG